ncbi:hypothetical protein GCM10012287_18290 [Streptomyces daqingensis]|uniref:Uncharacterized protein n=1 Tax=Streptomyces daqingensis TaxID=1472640 RepID=A0ABQ2M4Q5_9ACTN|nr:hypothetical protein GCM10012287_18290 [Streptomyces daqingensis]
MTWPSGVGSSPAGPDGSAAAAGYAPGIVAVAVAARRTAQISSGRIRLTSDPFDGASFMEAHTAEAAWPGMCVERRDGHTRTVRLRTGQGVDHFGARSPLPSGPVVPGFLPHPSP